jgi:hypothetical protein
MAKFLFLDLGNPENLTFGPSDDGFREGGVSKKGGSGNPGGGVRGIGRGGYPGEGGVWRGGVGGV